MKARIPTTIFNTHLYSNNFLMRMFLKYTEFSCHISSIYAANAQINMKMLNEGMPSINTTNKNIMAVKNVEVNLLYLREVYPEICQKKFELHHCSQ